MRSQVVVLCLLQTFLLVLSDQDVKTVDSKLPAGGNTPVVSNSTTTPENVTQAIVSKENGSQILMQPDRTIQIEFDNTTIAPNVTTSVSPSSTTTPLPTPANNTTPNATSTTTNTPPTTQNPTTSSANPTSTSANPTTISPTTQPTLGPTTPKAENSTPGTPESRQFDGPSFIGGIVLTIGLTAIGFIAFKFYKADRIAKAENYRQL